MLGAKVAHLVDQAFAHGADAVVLGEHSLLRHFTIDAYAQAAFQALMSGKPGVFLLGAKPGVAEEAGRRIPCSGEACARRWVPRIEGDGDVDRISIVPIADDAGRE